MTPTATFTPAALPVGITGGMVAALPATELPVDEEVGPPHVTLVYLGDDAASIADEARMSINEMLSIEAAEAPQIRATIAGIGTLGDKGATVLLLNSAALVDSHDELQFALETIELAPAWSFDGFLPHLTLSYTRPADDPAFEGLAGTEIVFDRLAAVYGTESVEFELAGADDEPAAPVQLAVARFTPRLEAFPVRHSDSDGRFLPSGAGGGGGGKKAKKAIEGHFPGGDGPDATAPYGRAGDGRPLNKAGRVKTGSAPGDTGVPKAKYTPKKAAPADAPAEPKAPAKPAGQVADLSKKGEPRTEVPRDTPVDSLRREGSDASFDAVDRTGVKSKGGTNGAHYDKDGVPNVSTSASIGYDSDVSADVSYKLHSSGTAERRVTISIDPEFAPSGKSMYEGDAITAAKAMDGVWTKILTGKGFTVTGETEPTRQVI